MKHISAEDAAGLVSSGMWIDYGVTLCQPDVFDAALAKRMLELNNVKVRFGLSLRPRAFLEADPQCQNFVPVSWHFSGYDRAKLNGQSGYYVPMNLGEGPDFYRRLIEPVEIAIIKVCPMDAGGYFNFGPTNLWHRAMIEHAQIVIVEISKGIPYTYGIDNGVHRSEVDYIIEGDDMPAAELLNPPATDVDRLVARHVANEIGDGCCIQIGIGAMPNAVCSMMLDSGVKDIGVHTEMLTDGLIELYKAGRITGARKALFPSKLAFTFALGSRDLYSTIEQNPDMMCLPVDISNLPHMIMQNDNVVAINSTTQIDLQGQAASESDGTRHLTGTGGQLQFVRGAYASRNGKSFICMSSTYQKGSIRRSRIVTALTPGNIVTTPRSDIMYVVTEYGIANLKGASVAERARSLIEIAHPDFREDLEREAYEHGLIPYCFRGDAFAPKSRLT